MRIIATWTREQNPAVDAPIRLRWDDGSPATTFDFGRIATRSQSDPDVSEATVEYSYEVVPDEPYTTLREIVADAISQYADAEREVAS